ncbi:MAG: hypothetical protein AB8C84_12575 [Oligoflexales bacterium]
MKKYFKIQSFLCLSMLFFGCVTDSSYQPPVIDSSTDLSELLEAGVNFGGMTLAQVRQEVARRKVWPEAGKLLYEGIKNHKEDWPSSHLINAIHLYHLSKDSRSVEVFNSLLNAEKKSHQQLAWHMAALRPSPRMADAVDQALTKALMNGDLSQWMGSRMADAIAKNQLISSYSILKQGLFVTHDESYAKAMMSLKPRAASEDFLDYLAMAPVEELRQLSLNKVNMMTCSLMLSHFQEYPPSISHPRFEHLFLYSISRNNGFSELSSKVLERYYGRYGQQLAVQLASMPEWIQIAVVDHAGRNLTPGAGQFLKQLRKTTARNSVISEIDTVVFR